MSVLSRISRNDYKGVAIMIQLCKYQKFYHHDGGNYFECCLYENTDCVDSYGDGDISDCVKKVIIQPSKWLMVTEK